MHFINLLIQNKYTIKKKQLSKLTAVKIYYFFFMGILKQLPSFLQILLPLRVVIHFLKTYSQFSSIFGFIIEKFKFNNKKSFFYQNVFIFDEK